MKGGQVELDSDSLAVQQWAAVTPRVLFINPPSVPYTMLVDTFDRQYVSLTQTVAMPMGILYLAAVLERDLPSVEIRVLDLALAYRRFCDAGRPHAMTIDAFIRAHLPNDFTPDVVGISILFSTAHKTTLHIADAVKERWPGSRVVVGGMHATNAVASLLERESIDLVCRGEAETTVVDLVRGAQPQGFIGRTNLTDRASCPLITDLDAIPFPAWHLIPMDEYLYGVNRARRLDKIDQDGIATIVTTRGCPFRCTFCASWTVHGREMRYRSVQNVIKELEILYERYGAREVVPEDDLFTVKKSRIIGLCEAVAERFHGTLSFQFPNGLSVATLDEDVIRAMTLMGMRVANIAIESGSPHVQKYVIKKHVDLERATRVVDACRRNDVIVRAYFILGFPGETRDQMQQTIDFARALCVDWATIHPAAPLVGTEMYHQMLERGDIDSSFNWDSAFFAERAFDTPEVGAQELKTLCYRANLELNFFENYNLRVGNWDTAIALYKDILRAYPGHLAAQYCIALALRGKGEAVAAEAAIEEARTMLAEIPMAQRMYEDFRELFPELTITEADVVA